ncbi:YihY/virulence factor BrkB family protein [Candidatus Chloroploca sp. M-50]|uniref:YihY/virulence factor BrkB family protein n=1 Tax=Candidatus Chloroploca mongolica TaxID=2528176 RepID=A0ABS4DBH0_9CHLR|nr:YihY/virulence factor BrkB family protein [Candidatus Chloroploca mongolica]MBP1466787.1 YihY/virulence factor BrkB family protein [Candidatus Chloroploca mongolica]
MLDRVRAHPVVRLGQVTLAKYQKDLVNNLAAAIAYFAVFSFFPMILVVVSLVGFLIDVDSVEVQEQLLVLVGSDEIRALITQTLANFRDNRLNAGLLGFATLFMTASGIFAALSRSFDVIWENRPGMNGKKTGLVAAAVAMLLNRLAAFSMLLISAAVILLAMMANVAMSVVSSYTDWLPGQDLFYLLGQVGVTLVLLTLVFAAMFKLLPSQRIYWRDVFPAAFIASIGFALLQSVASLIFANINYASYGAVGGMMTLLLWIFLSAQVILIGGEISFAWTYIFGTRKGQPIAVLQKTE